MMKWCKKVYCKVNSPNHKPQKRRN